ncbi:hypothetical protein ABZ079_01520 [Streptomyces sp. NPDC006314]|uniref:hypothetical protein n=1 Tax=Streptomyces sp. NPDC006314 TaxID=3154475 RepID=UPI0033B3977E
MAGPRRAPALAGAGLHPCGRAAAELTAPRQDPAPRPSVPGQETRRVRPLWPLAVVLAVAWTAALVPP